MGGPEKPALEESEEVKGGEEKVQDDALNWLTTTIEEAKQRPMSAETASKLYEIINQHVSPHLKVHADRSSELCNETTASTASSADTSAKLETLLSQAKKCGS
eukprot:Platyproteum_vivax@DN1622_c0_g1_i1.p1